MWVWGSRTEPPPKIRSDNSPPLGHFILEMRSPKKVWILLLHLCHGLPGGIMYSMILPLYPNYRNLFILQLPNLLIYNPNRQFKVIQFFIHSEVHIANLMEEYIYVIITHERYYGYYLTRVVMLVYMRMPNSF